MTNTNIPSLASYRAEMTATRARLAAAPAAAPATDIYIAGTARRDAMREAMGFKLGPDTSNRASWLRAAARDAR